MEKRGATAEQALKMENGDVASIVDEASELPVLRNHMKEENQKSSSNDYVQRLFEKAFEHIERLAIILCHDIFDEIEAAIYLRLPDPYNKGAETIRYHALRSRKLSFHKLGKNGLIFLRSDLDKALKNFKFESHRDL